jgi:predicted DNA-binding ribbon-helix-helix protein
VHYRLGKTIQISVKKRAIDINGRKTSISLEDTFWSSLKEIATSRGETMRRVIASIDANRQSYLSSAIRLFVLEFYKEQLARQEQQEIPVQRADHIQR